MARQKYGRGKFPAHNNYIRYIETLVRLPAYKGMPNAVSADGRVNWQVSSGKTTSFYKDYVARFAWWVKKADSLRVPGHRNSNDRFSITARLIHPTGYRPCRLCGESRNVGYFYLSDGGVRTLNKLVRARQFKKSEPIDKVLGILRGTLGESGLQDVLLGMFPERRDAFKKYGPTKKAFESTNFLRSRQLSPGFMCNPPDRLDGFHDYCVYCREKNDPGRSKENLRSYIHDRRAFEYWSEGDWLVADALFNAAGSGTCSVCGEKVKKISPDHVGPLACGFKQIPYFIPMCGPCNSSKNRRMTAKDVTRLIAYEKANRESVASWPVRSLWDANKHLVKDDADAKELSDHMRALQDLYLRTLKRIEQVHLEKFLVHLLNPGLAMFDVRFEGLDPATLTFTSFSKTPIDQGIRQNLIGRSIRISFEELDLYATKPIESRKVRKSFIDKHRSEIEKLLVEARAVQRNKHDIAWTKTLANKTEKERTDAQLTKLYLEEAQRVDNPKYESLEREIKGLFRAAGNIRILKD